MRHPFNFKIMRERDSRKVSDFCSSACPAGFASGSPGQLRCSSAARPRWDRRTMGAGPGVSEEGANLICRFRRKNVLKLAGLLLDFRLAIHRQAVGEKAFGETVAADEADGAFTASRSEFHDQRTVPCRRRHRLKRFMAGDNE